MTSGHRISAPLYVAANLALGLGLGMAGPSLTMLKRQVSVGTGAIGVVFTAQGLGYLVASQVIARGYDRGWGHRLQGTSLLVAAAAFALVPSVDSVEALAAVFLVAGLAIGTVDVGSNAQTMWAKRDRAGGWLAALHLGFGVGALTSPLVSRWSESNAGDTTIAFRLPAAIAVVVAVALLSTRGPAPQHLLDPAALAVDTGSGRRSSDRPPGLLWFVAFILCYVGGEVGFTSWVNTYGREIGQSAGSAAALNSVFWATFTLGRLANISIARSATRFRPLLVASSLAAVATLPLLTLNAALAWPSVALLGLVTGPQFPLNMALVGRHVTLSGRRMGWFMGAAGLGSLTWPWLIGSLLDRYGPRALPVAIGLLFVGATVVASIGAPRIGRDPDPQARSDAEGGRHQRRRGLLVTDEADAAVVLATVQEQHQFPRRPAHDDGR